MKDPFGLGSCFLGKQQAGNGRKQHSQSGVPSSLQWFAAYILSGWDVLILRRYCKALLSLHWAFPAWDSFYCSCSSVRKASFRNMNICIIQSRSSWLKKLTTVGFTLWTRQDMSKMSCIYLRLEGTHKDHQIQLASSRSIRFSHKKPSSQTQADSAACTQCEWWTKRSVKSLSTKKVCFGDILLLWVAVLPFMP